VYASWNGSTETASWQVFAGKKSKKLALVAASPKTGFETVIDVDAIGPYFQVRALNASGDVIGVSELMKL